MRKIEFIGASGTGKSTLFEEVLKNRGEEDTWITPTEGRIQIVKKMSSGQYHSPLYKIMLTVIKLNLFKKNHSAIATFLLKKSKKERLALQLQEYDPLIKIFLQGMMMDLHMESYRKGQFIRFYLNLIETDLLLLEDIVPEQLIVYDDGIIHNTEGITNEKFFNEMVQSNSKILEKILPDGVVFCELSEIENYKRRKSRIVQGKGTMIENNLSDQQLKDLCHTSMEESKETIAILEAFSIPVLRINMDDDFEKNIDIVNEFIRKISQNVFFKEERSSFTNLISLEGK